MKRVLTIVILVLFLLRCFEKKTNNESNIKSLLIQQLKNAHTNQQWFVPTKKAIDGLTLEQSNWKDSSDNHSIGELVSHLIFWNELNLRAFKGCE